MSKILFYFDGTSLADGKLQTLTLSYVTFKNLTHLDAKA
jgi:hypothetical protein